MPSNTFKNLPQKKKEKILKIALEEFSLHDYKSASLSRIVEKANIAKGSIYQYFKNKKDLYFYLVHLSASKKLTYLKENLTPGKDFFTTLKEMHLVGLKFDLNLPEYSRLLILAGSEMDEEIKKMYQKLLKSTEDFFMEFSKNARENGEIRNDIPLDLACFLLSRISLLVSEYLGYKYDFSYADLIKKENSKFPIDMNDLEKELDKIIKFLKDGLSG